MLRTVGAEELVVILLEQLPGDLVAGRLLGQQSVDLVRGCVELGPCRGGLGALAEPPEVDLDDGLVSLDGSPCCDQFW